MKTFALALLLAGVANAELLLDHDKLTFTGVVPVQLSGGAGGLHVDGGLVLAAVDTGVEACVASAGTRIVADVSSGALRICGSSGTCAWGAVAPP